jgi:hypothetical protein
MPGETSGEVMRRKASAEVMPPSVGRNALKSISGRKARFAGKLLLVQRALSYHEPPPPTPFLCFFLQLASWNLQLSFYKRSAGSPLLSVQRNFERDPVQDHYGMTKQKKRKTM